jgi:hypothetical protein
MTAVKNQAVNVPVLDPVFVMCNGRSGSTLLRFLLDAHPELACPPETNLPSLCAKLATVWSLIEGAPLSANRGDEPPDIPESAITGIRHTMDRMLGSYLDRRGRRRYCDKSLGTARFADLLVRVYPEARFVCLYRHPMDVIASGIEACPWGLNGYGFDPYIAESPGNAVLALARFWADNARAVLAVEERYPDKCHRIRYEDMVADPERIASELFAFLGASPVPGISSACFSSERERFGPGDYKIWCTEQITDASVGRGWSIPTGMISPQVLAQVSELTSKLGYLHIGDDWGTTEPPSSMLQQAADPSAETITQPLSSSLPVQDTAGEVDERALIEHSRQLGERLRTGLGSAVGSLNRRWDPHMSESFVAVSISGRPAAATEYWLVNLKEGIVTSACREVQEKSDWDIIGSAEAWDKIIQHELNLQVALRTCQLRYCDEANAGPVVAETRTRILAGLLGLASW